MKKLLFLLALGAFSPVSAQNIQTPGVYVNQGAPLPDGAPFVWRLQLQAGQKFLTTTDTSTESTQQMPAMPRMAKTAVPLTMGTRAQSHMVIEQNVLSSDENGARVEVIYREVTQSTKMSQGDKVIYDSATPPEALKNMSDMLKGMVGARISYLLAPDGQISDVQGAEEYLNRLLEGMEKSLGQTPAAVTQQKSMRVMMSSFLSPETLKNSLGSAYRAMPKVPVALGESWKYEMTTPVMGTTFTQSGQSTFVSRAGNVVTIAQKGDFATDAGAEIKIPGAAIGNQPGQEKTPAPITQIDLHGELSGETTVDQSNGMTLSSRIMQNMEGELVMSGLTGKGSTMTVPMKVRAETTSKTEELKTTP